MDWLSSLSFLLGLLFVLGLEFYTGIVGETESYFFIITNFIFFILFLFFIFKYIKKGSYYIVVTSLGVHLFYLSFLGNRIINYNFIEWYKISDIKLSRFAFLNTSYFKFIGLTISLPSNEKFKFKALLRGFKKLAFLDDKTKNFLISKYKDV